MPRYATQTEVPVERSKAEIEQMLIRYNATAFTTGWNTNSAMIAFELKELHVRFVLPWPDRNDVKFKKKKVRNYYKQLTQIQSDRVFDQAIRQRWRALALVVKAKLEAVECGISTLEREFLAFIVMPGGERIGDWIIENAIPSIRAGKMPLALAGRKPDSENITDAEVVIGDK